jgi:hypothetical protein
MSGKATAEAPKNKGKWTSGFGAILIGTFCLVLIGMVAYFNLKNRKSMAHILRADVDFIAAPQTVDPGGSSRFVIQVAQDMGGKGEKPLAGRVLDVTVTPSGKAEILAVSGDEGQLQAASGARAKGRTDDSGRMEVTVRAAEPGRYTLLALDSASGKGGTVNFRAVAPEG